MAEHVQVAISADGTEIVGRVGGQGQPLVLVHGGWGDGEVAYEALVPHLADRFTCYTPSTRGRGLSGDNPDHAVHRLVEDVVAFIDTIGEPVCLLGWSGIEPPLGAAAQSSSVAAVALFEGYVPAVAEPDDLAALGAAIERTGTAAADGRLADAARAFAPYVITGAELGALDGNFFERWGAASPPCFSISNRTCPRRGPRPMTPTSLRGSRCRSSPCGAPRRPTLICLEVGTAPGPAHRRRTRPRTGRPGAPAPLVAPELLAKELASFFESAR